MFKNITIIILTLVCLILLFSQDSEILIQGDKLEPEMQTNYYFYPYGIQEDKEIQKTLALISSMQKIAATEYVKDVYDCKHFSKDLKEELARHGIDGRLVIGEMNGEGHMWVEIRIEATTGRFIDPNEDYVETLYEN